MIKLKERLLGVIDIGSHAVRLDIGQILRKGKIDIIEQLWLPIAIGRDTFSNGTISGTTISELVNSLKNFKKVLESYNVGRVKAVATSGLREALNADILIDRIYNATGFKIEIIDTVEETEIIFKCLKNQLKKNVDLENRNVFIFLVGAGTTQAIYMKKGRILFSEAFSIGTLRLQKMYSLHQDSYKLYIENTALKINSFLGNYRKKEDIDKLVIINDDILYVIKNLEKKRKNRMPVLRLSKKFFINFYRDLYTLSMREVMEKYEMRHKFSDTTMIALLLVGVFFELIRAKRIVFPDINLSSSLMWNMSISNDKNVSRAVEFRKDIISAAMELAKKYHSDMSHIQRVRKIALMFFDQVRQKFRFSPDERLYLEVAAILHDIGKYINFKSHHKHSATLISSSAILGLSAEEMSLISQIARYHRKSLPKKTHIDYNMLNEKQRITISHMASILKLSDGMDKTYPVGIDDVKLKINDSIFELQVKFAGNNYKHLDLFKMEVKNKSDFFEKLFGVEIKVEKMV